MSESSFKLQCFVSAVASYAGKYGEVPQHEKRPGVDYAHAGNVNRRAEAHERLIAELKRAYAALPDSVKPIAGKSAIEFIKNMAGNKPVDAILAKAEEVIEKVIGPAQIIFRSSIRIQKDQSKPYRPRKARYGDLDPAVYLG